MSQKLGFPYLGTGLMAIIFLIFGVLFSTVVYLLGYIANTALIIAALRFIGIFFTGWALLAFSLNKDLLPMQRLIATFFALLTLVSVFYVFLKVPLLSFGFNVAHLP